MQQINGGVDRMDQDISAYMTNLRSKKSRWPPLFRFLLDVSFNNAFQLYRMRNIDQAGKILDALGFTRVIVDAYFRKFRKSATNTTLHPGNRLLHNPEENLQYNNCGPWIVKGA